MSKTFYFEDPSGAILSENGQRRFKKTDGKDGYSFLHIMIVQVISFLV